MNRYYVMHDRNTRYREVDATSLCDVYRFASYRFGGEAGKSIKMLKPSSSNQVYDDVRIVRSLYPNAKYSGLSEVPANYAMELASGE